MEKYILTSNEMIYFAFKLCISLLDKTGSHEQLMVEGSIVMDDSAVISATRVLNDGNEVMLVGNVKKSLDEQHWWDTSNNLDTEQSKKIWVCVFLCI